MHIPHLIEFKREGGELSPAQIAEVIRRFTNGEMHDYQMSALAMAIFFRGMTPHETTAMTAAMRDSGRVFQWPKDSPPKVDKHSTGGVGDKVSLILAPLLACEGLWVPMVSGRGLGITGGTLDKLESIPGFNVHLDEAHCLAQIEKIGVFMAGQTADFCPADRKLYALRDVTGTVPSQPLIVASIMAKKLAESLDRLVLDVKFGRGAFMKTRAEAEALAQALRESGIENGLETHALLTPMDEPLGRTAGNALEVAESLRCLRGEGPADLEALVLALAEPVTRRSAAELRAHLTSGRAYEKFLELVEAQGGKIADLEKWDTVHPARLQKQLIAERSGRVTRVDAGEIGKACVILGAGRAKAADTVDYAAGVSELIKCGVVVERGEPLLRVHANSESRLKSAWAHLQPAIEIES